MSMKTEFSSFSGDDYHLSAGHTAEAVRAALSDLVRDNILARIQQRDHRVWKPLPTEISNRLGWLDSPAAMLPQIGRIKADIDLIRADGFTHALLLGMGGSSLAPEVFAKTFGIRQGYLELSVLDSTHPDAISAAWRRCPPDRTLLIVSTKSGGTVETLSLFKASFNWVATAVGIERAPRHCIAITDPGSGLQTLVEKLGVRSVFLNDPDIGGRYSVLSSFGMVPAAIVGVDISALLSRGQRMFERIFSSPCTLSRGNSAAVLGCLLGVQAGQGNDKLTLLLPECIASFGGWVEQLVAESIGKEGYGILPVPITSLEEPAMYRRDQTFVAITLADQGPSVVQTQNDKRLKSLIDAGFPVMTLPLGDLTDLGAEFVRWEMATIIAAWKLGINPFDQPNVESAKVLARKMVAMYQQDGRLPELEPTSMSQGITLYDESPASSPAEGFTRFLSLIDADERTPPPYVSIHAYLPPTVELDAVLERLAAAIGRRFRVAVTVGYGPRFLHSTGQLHKGDAGHGLFIQFVGPVHEDIPIPDAAGDSASTISFGVLVNAQSLGDRQALIDGGRRVIRFDCGQNAVEAIDNLSKLVSE